MPQAIDLSSLEDNVKTGENIINGLKEEIKSLMSAINKKQEDSKIKFIREENKKLQSEINIVKRELIRLQVANGVPQIPIPGEDGGAISESEPGIRSSEMKEYSFSSSLAVDSSESKKVESSENASNETKPAKAAKVKKPAAPAVSDGPVDVSRLDIRVGKILHAQVHPDADGLYIEQIDVGDEISRTVVSGLVKHVPLNELDQRMVVVLCNLKPQKMRGIVSEAMVLCASTPQTVELLIPPADAKAGDNITVPGYPRNPDLPFMNPKKKIFEKVAEDLKVNSNKQACYKEVPWEVEGKGGYITVQAMSGCHIK
ncbi:aminoacyl tRNA synthase complex-interacting multifunctional protein 1-like isoform X2 [Macrosteles quadrilineatus]|nr:aminoacyl tRNA synthase complex-interacting multifunctional protein 1-like isoform X2 [Macrosteles quadrilineatus]